jgi:hypothetical protein
MPATSRFLEQFVADHLRKQEILDFRTRVVAALERKNSVWLPTLDTFRTFATRLALRSNLWTTIVLTVIRADR